jgi:hypothetical protein
MATASVEDLPGLSLGSEAYEQLSKSLLGDWQVSEEDGERIVKRLRELLGMVREFSAVHNACMPFTAVVGLPVQCMQVVL